MRCRFAEAGRARRRGHSAAGVSTFGPPIRPAPDFDPDFDFDLDFDLKGEPPVSRLRSQLGFGRSEFRFDLPPATTPTGPVGRR